ncbi:MAG TPA: GntR family transcriptional regulator [Streptosporangiaceae bacterium]|nr:GntR family transcriptional regulator [Streptosporangiaceae bacterium]
MPDRPASALGEYPPDLVAESPTPLYVQLADWLAGLVDSGRLASGKKLPPERDLADEWGVSYMTVRRTMKELRERGLVESTLGKGTFIASRSTSPWHKP